MKTYEPIYPHSSIYAGEHDELEAFRASNSMNLACRDALEKAISDNYNGRWLDTKAVYNTVVEEYGAERVMLMIANTIQVKDWDGRISPYNKTWAKEIPMPESFGEPGNSRRRSYVLNSHPGLVDMVTTTFRQEQALREREAAKQPTQAADFELKVWQDGTAAISRYKGQDKDVAIPEEIDGHKIDSIGHGAFANCTSLRSISIPDSVEYIREGAFEGCTSLESVNIPEGVIYINDYTFCGCTSLKDITIPEGVIRIEENAFGNCESLKSVTIPEGVKEIGRWAFQRCSSLENISIPESVTVIGDHAFDGCTALTNIAIPEGVTRIGDYAFWGCTSLESISIPEGVIGIREGTFAGCSKLESISIPESLKYIGEAALLGCSSLENLVIPDNVEVSNYAFSGRTSEDAWLDKPQDDYEMEM